jgi:hypothetical protein
MNLRISNVLIPIVWAALAAGCAGYGPPRAALGEPVESVVRQMGTPTARYGLDGGGTRLEFARGPYGTDTYMVDVDAQGRVTTWRQVLTETNFNAVQAGITSQALLTTLGTPTHRRGGGLQGGEVWSYRYRATFCQWFQVSVVDGRVRDTSYGPDPLCDVNDDRLASRERQRITPVVR